VAGRAVSDLIDWTDDPAIGLAAKARSSRLAYTRNGRMAGP